MRASRRAARFLVPFLFILLFGCETKEERLKSELDSWAVICDPARVKSALKEGANVRATDEHGTALHRAFLMLDGRYTKSRYNDEYLPRAREVIAILLDAGADPNARNDSGTTPLMLAAGNGDEEIIVRLIKAGADTTAIDNGGDTAADYAFKSHHEGIGLALRDLARVQPMPPTPTPSPLPTPSNIREHILNEWKQ